MAITITCTSCQTRMNAADTLAGRKAKCPSCGQIIQVPASTGPMLGEPAPIVSSPRNPDTGPRRPAVAPDPAPFDREDPDEHRDRRDRRDDRGERRDGRDRDDERDRDDDRGRRDDRDRRDEYRDRRDERDSRDDYRDERERRPRPQSGNGVAMGLGVGSLILGIISLPFALIPCLGMFSLPLSGLGFLLGIIGLILAIRMKGKDVGMPIAGSAVSTVSLLFGLFWLVLFGALAASKPGNSSSSAMVNSVTELSTSRKANPAPIGADWSKVGNSYEGKDVKITLVYAVVNRLDSRDDQPFLYVKLKVENTSNAKTLIWSGWQGKGTATDEFDVPLAYDLPQGLRSRPTGPDKKQDADLAAGPLDDRLGRTIEPMKSYATLLFLEDFPQASKELRLTLPASAFDPTSSEDLYFRVPVTNRVRP